MLRAACKIPQQMLNIISNNCIKYLLCVKYVKILKKYLLIKIFMLAW